MTQNQSIDEFLEKFFKTEAFLKIPKKNFKDSLNKFQFELKIKKQNIISNSDIMHFLSLCEKSILLGFKDGEVAVFLDTFDSGYDDDIFDFGEMVETIKNQTRSVNSFFPHQISCK